MRKVDPQAVAAVSFITILGLGVRLAIVVPASFPLNDGGLFYTMINDLAANGLRLPAFTTYNGSGIPFAYPPLAFYLYAVLHLVLQIPVSELMRFGPAIVSAASIPVFYLLARDVTGSAQRGVLATLAFALIPRAFDWIIMGGGTTRSLGLVFALLAIHAAYRLFIKQEHRALIWLTIYGSLAVYSHPEAALHMGISTGLFYLWRDRSLKGLMYGLAAAAGAAVLTAPWWGGVLAQHGLGPFLAATSAARADSYGPIQALVTFLRLDFADEPFIAVLTVVGLVGLGFEISRRRYLLSAWILTMYMLEPRGAPTFMMIPLALGAGIALDGIFLPALTPDPSRAEGKTHPAATDWLPQLVAPASSRWLLACIILFATASAYAVGWRVREQLSLKASDLQALEWVRASTSASSRFAVVTGQLPFRDASSEWFPAITGRQSLATVFGYEWVDDGRFTQRIAAYRGLQACAQRDVGCLTTWVSQYGLAFDYVYVQNPSGVQNVSLVEFLDRSTSADNVYRSATVAIYMLRQGAR